MVRVHAGHLSNTIIMYIRVELISEEETDGKLLHFKKYFPDIEMISHIEKSRYSLLSLHLGCNPIVRTRPIDIKNSEYLAKEGYEEPIKLFRVVMGFTYLVIGETFDIEGITTNTELAKFKREQTFLVFQSDGTATVIPQSIIEKSIVTIKSIE